MTVSLFEREMRSQVATAQTAVSDAESGGDPLLLQAARNHLDSLLSLARRNGLTFESASEPTSLLEPAVAPAVAG